MKVANDDLVEAALRKKKPRTAQHDQDMPMGWFCWLIEGKLCIGPPPTDDHKIRFLRDKCKVTHILNLRKWTDETTEKGNNKASTYTWMMKDEKMKLVRDYRFEEDPYNMNESGMIAYFVSLAKSVKEPGENEIFFLHYETGREQEAFLGMLLWYLWKPDSFPADYEQWIAHDRNDSIIDDPIIRGDILKLALEKCKVNKQSQRLLQWLKKK
jgi:hypothetical protein